jgi:hypothetical protein
MTDRFAIAKDWRQEGCARIRTDYRQDRTGSVAGYRSDKKHVRKTSGFAIVCRRVPSRNDNQLTRHAIPAFVLSRRQSFLTTQWSFQ